MFKLIFSDSRFMSIFLERILGDIGDISIVNKYNNRIINPINVREYLMQEINNCNVYVKRKNLDLLVKTNDYIIDIEYNSIFDEEVRKRNYAYLSGIYSNILKKTKKYKDMPKVVQINICSSVCEDYDSDIYYLFGRDYNNVLIDNVNFIVINVAKYKKILYTNSEELIKKYAHIIMFDCNREELEKLSKYDDFVKEVKDMLDEYNSEEKIFSFLTDEESRRILMENVIEGRIERATEKAEIIGEKRGEKRGEKKGIKTGKLEIAKKMLQKSFSLKEIEELTGLKQSYLENIKI
jgi:predicted transposase/invertase (TIGR01784 family)